MKFVPFVKEHLDLKGNTLLASGYIMEKYGDMYENCASGTLMDDQNMPIISFGLSILWPGVAEVWTFPRPSIKDHGLAVTRIVKRVLRDSIAGNNLHRVQARCAVGDDIAFNWLQFFGFKLEGKLSKYGPDMKDYYLLAIVRE